MGWRERWLPLSPWWRNFGFSDWKIAFIFFLCVFGSWAYVHDTAAFREVYEDPCAYCPLVKGLDGKIPVVVSPGDLLLVSNLSNESSVLAYLVG